MGSASKGRVSFIYTTLYLYSNFHPQGERYKVRYPGIFQDYQSGRYEFQYTDFQNSNRTRDTARALAEGFWGTYGTFYHLWIVLSQWSLNYSWENMVSPQLS